MTNSQGNPEAVTELPENQRWRQKYQKKPIKLSTKKTYSAYLNMFGIQKLPATTDIIIEWLETARTQKDDQEKLLSASAVGQAVAALSWWHNQNGHPDPTQDPDFKAAVQQIKQGRAQAMPAQRARAITLDELTAIINTAEDKITQYQHFPSRQLLWIRDIAYVLIFFYTASRVSEVCAIRYENITFLQEGLKIKFPDTKTGPLEKYIPRYDCQGDLNPAVAALDRWLTISQIKSGFIFRKISQQGVIMRNPSKALTREGFGYPVIIKMAEQAGINMEAVNTHSLRAGAVTVMDQHGTSLQDMMQLTGHRSPATIVQYIRPTDEMQLANAPMKVIAMGTSEGAGRSGAIKTKNSFLSWLTFLKG